MQAAEAAVVAAEGAAEDEEAAPNPHLPPTSIVRPAEAITKAQGTCCSKHNIKPEMPILTPLRKRRRLPSGWSMLRTGWSKGPRL